MLVWQHVQLKTSPEKALPTSYSTSRESTQSPFSHTIFLRLHYLPPIRFHQVFQFLIFSRKIWGTLLTTCIYPRCSIAFSKHQYSTAHSTSHQSIDSFARRELRPPHKICAANLQFMTHKESQIWLAHTAPLWISLWSQLLFHFAAPFFAITPLLPQYSPPYPLRVHISTWPAIEGRTGAHALIDPLPGKMLPKYFQWRWTPKVHSIPWTARLSSAIFTIACGQMIASRVNLPHQIVLQLRAALHKDFNLLNINEIATRFTNFHASFGAKLSSVPVPNNA